MDVPPDPPEFREWLAQQPSVADAWRTSVRGDWNVRLAAHRLGRGVDRRQIAFAATVLGRYSRAPTWRRMLHFTAAPEDQVRRWTDPNEFDLDQLLAHLFLGLAIGCIVGMIAFAKLAPHGVLVQKAIGIAVAFSVAAVVTAIAQGIWSLSVRAATRMRRYFDSPNDARVP